MKSPTRTLLEPSSMARGSTPNASCPACGTLGMATFWQVMGMPTNCHVLCRTREQAVEVPRGDITLAYCEACGLIANTRFDPQLMNYCPEYENALDCSPKFQAYMDELADRLIARHNLRGKQIVEIACGRGEFLKTLCRKGGNQGVGFDPGCPDSPGEGSAVRYVRSYYGPEHAGVLADLICCRHALEHIADPQSFLAMLRRNIGERTRTRVFFEVPNALYTLRQFGIWDIIYEHCSYYSAEALAGCFARCGFDVHEVWEAYDGQFLCLEATPVDGVGRVPAGLIDLDQLRRDVQNFGRNYDCKIETWTHRLAEAAAAGRKIVLWGSGSKGVTFLNTLPHPEQVAAVVDINPRKQGMFVAGAGQQIIAPQALRTLRPDIVVVMNPIYADEIKAGLAELGLTPELMLA